MHAGAPAGFEKTPWKSAGATGREVIARWARASSADPASPTATSAGPCQKANLLDPWHLSLYIQRSILCALRPAGCAARPPPSADHRLWSDAASAGFPVRRRLETGGATADHGK